MRFGLIHRIMTDAIAVLGILSLVTSGELSRPVSAIILLGLLVAVAVPERWQAHPLLRRVSTFAPVVVLVAQLARLLLGSSMLAVAIEFAAGLQVVRLATRRGAAHDQQVIVLALLHLIAGTVIGGNLAYGLCFLGFIIVAPGALALSHLRREVEGNYRQGARDRTGLPVDVPRILRSRRVVDRTFVTATCLLAIPIFLFTAALFVLFPRIGLSLLLISKPRAGRMVGFADKVDLGQVGTLRTDPTIVLRVEVPDLSSPPPRLSMHLRGAAFDTYNGRSWSRSLLQHEPAAREGGMVWIRRPPDPSHDRPMQIDLEPIEPSVLFLPLGTSAFQARRRGDPILNSKLEIWAGAEGEFRYTGAEDRGIRYTAYLPTRAERPEPLSAPDLERYLALPPSLSPRIRQLALSLARPGASSYEKAHAVESHLRSHYSYDLGSPSGAASDPLDDFLFVSHRGHCEYYSTAMVVLLRHLRVPARNVTGFIGGTYNRFGHYYAVRQGDAHSWVEVYLPESGWQTFDPTPPGEAEPKSEMSGAVATVRDILEAMGQRWDRYVLGYDLRQQVYLFDSLSRYSKTDFSLRDLRPSGRWLYMLGPVALTGFGVWLLRKRRRKDGVQSPESARQARHQMWATALYEALDAAMAARGVARSACTPPLRHAQSLQTVRHPLAAEILDLTQIYLEARFGGLWFDSDVRGRIEARVRRVRTAPLPVARDPSTPSAPSSHASAGTT